MKLFLLLFISFATTTLLQASDWTTDYKAALEQAATQKKLLLLQFVGDDGYGYGKLLEKEVLSQAPFQDYADKNFVLVRIDLSSSAILSAQQKQQNEALKQQYNVQGYPSLVIITSKGTSLQKFDGYEAGTGAEAFVAQLKSKLYR